MQMRKSKPNVTYFSLHDDLDGPCHSVIGKGNAHRRATLVDFILRRDGPNCWFCDLPFSVNLQPTIEHLIPLSVGGPRWLAWNCVAACERCNHNLGSAPLVTKLNLRKRTDNRGKTKIPQHIKHKKKMELLKLSDIQVFEELVYRLQELEHGWKNGEPIQGKMNHLSRLRIQGERILAFQVAEKVKLGGVPRE